MAIVVQAPEKTRQVLELLEGWSPEKGIRFTLERHEGAELTLEVSGLDDDSACKMAQRRIRDALGEVPFLRIAPRPAAAGR